VTPDQSAILRALGSSTLTARQIADAAFGADKQQRASVYRHLEVMVRDGWVIADNTQRVARWTRTDAGTEALRVFDAPEGMDPHAVVRMIVKNGRVGD
jgi:Fe2+ or Zn2+ uptake regulation protein